MSGSMSAPARTLHQRRGRSSVSFLAPNLSLPRKAKAETKSPVVGLSTACNTRLIVGVFHDIHKDATAAETDERLQAFANYLIKSFEDEFAPVMDTADFQTNLKEYVKQRERNEAPESSPMVPLFKSFYDRIVDLPALVPT
ncbi:hypothetical protein SARC_05636 [Sphaeroforma arctica JP610]|uniref:Uncharacterized protein n=1 Tax=Sphaeroforma arctica JP610 TaxID=667725 RepID=A0A0L0FZ49_9EUKA|nr:hypothetical protein SARC_05636 [Sphaeroforma arctica JP610]KNC82085.1 hypothetical protein SARC_05636 [Sphaeroforma arctica JP610]|eukprot:XP_014155987.1 hypothetical protein SARC_05636 [Sphaeroforma arctica JP610]